MEKKISKGVKIFAWLMIVLNIIMFLSALDYKTFFDCFRSFDKNFIILMIVYSILASIIGIIAGIGLLRLNEAMRKIGIVINSLDFLFGVPLFYFALRDIKQYSYAIVLSQGLEEIIKSDINSFANVIFYSIVFISYVTFGLNLLLIFFFTRPKVKEQFK